MSENVKWKDQEKSEAVTGARIAFIDEVADVFWKNVETELDRRSPGAKVEPRSPAEGYRHTI